MYDKERALFAEEELREAHRALLSTLSKCEKAFLKLAPGTPQHTLTLRRIKALQIALTLIEQAQQTQGYSLKEE